MHQLREDVLTRCCSAEFHHREKRAGHEVIRIPMLDGKADGSYEDSLTGFVVDDNSVWGCPVGVAIGKDGSMFVTDDDSRSVWHITYEGK